MHQPVAVSAYKHLSSLHSRKELHMEYPRVLAVLKFRDEVFDAMKTVKNLDDMAIFSLATTTCIGFGLQ